jgi:hypothetical protein
VTGRLRVGGHWNEALTTLVEEGPGPVGPDGRRIGDRLVGMVADPVLAARIVEAVNSRDSGVNSRRRAREDCAEELRALADRLPEHDVAALLTQLADEWAPR